MAPIPFILALSRRVTGGDMTDLNETELLPRLGTPGRMGRIGAGAGLPARAVRERARRLRQPFPAGRPGRGLAARPRERGREAGPGDLRGAWLRPAADPGRCPGGSRLPERGDRRPLSRSRSSPARLLGRGFVALSIPTPRRPPPRPTRHPPT